MWNSKCNRSAGNRPAPPLPALAPLKITAKILVERAGLARQNARHTVITVGHHNECLVPHVKNLRKRPRLGSAAATAVFAKPPLVAVRYCQDARTKLPERRKWPTAPSPAPWPGRHRNNLGRQLDRRRRYCFSDSSKSRRVSALGYLQDQRFVAAIFVEILVQLQPQLPGVHSDGAIFERTVIGRFVEQCVANVLLG